MPTKCTHWRTRWRPSGKPPTPKDVVELRSFLGLLIYYRKLMANLSTLLHPFNQLLQENIHGSGLQRVRAIFRKPRSSSVLPLYWSTITQNCYLGWWEMLQTMGLELSCSTASQMGLNTPLLSSRTLHPNKQNYAQVEKEALSLVFGI